MRSLRLLVIAVSAATVTFADEEAAFREWIFPGAKLESESASPTTAKNLETQQTRSVLHGYGQYTSDKPFHEVVAFYVRKSGLKPPNWSILDREFPGDTIQIPGHWSHVNLYRESPSVTILHNIREDVATLNLLKTDDPQLGTVTVTVTRGLNDDVTVIHLICHSNKSLRDE